MKHLLKKYSMLGFVLVSLQSMAQIPLQSVVEHFTNTSCSVCAANNAGIYAAIKNKPNILYVSFHPSSPYPSDIFNIQNKAENDDRTKFYNIYGATPRTILNGEQVSYSSLNAAIESKSSNMSNYSIDVIQTEGTNNQFWVQTVIKKIANDSSKYAKILVLVLEDTIQQTGNNGEPTHYHVFRKAMTAITGNMVELPANIGDSLVINNNFIAETSWDIKRLHSMAILQNNSKTLLNSGVSKNNKGSTGWKEEIFEAYAPFIFPNPINTHVIYSNLDLLHLAIFNQLGEKVMTIPLIERNQAISLENLGSGIYTLVAESIDSKFLVQKIVKQ